MKTMSNTFNDEYGEFLPWDLAISDATNARIEALTALEDVYHLTPDAFEKAIILPAIRELKRQLGE